MRFLVSQRPVTKDEYVKIVAEKDTYDLFVDGVKSEAVRKDLGGKAHTAKLSPGELGILIDIIQAGKPVRPHNTATGEGRLSSDTAVRLLQQARKKVDVPFGRNAFRAIHLRKHPNDRNLHKYEFSPPPDLKYCVIVHS